MAASAQLEEDILQQAVRLRLQHKSNAYALHSESATLVYTKGDAHSKVNSKVRDCEIACLVRDGVPHGAAAQFIADKITDLQAQLHADESPADNGHDDAWDDESLPDMS